MTDQQQREVMRLAPRTGLSGTPIAKWAEALNGLGKTLDNNEREVWARKIAGSDRMLFNRLIKHGIHKYIRATKTSDECYVCDVYNKDHLIHQVKK